METYDAQKSTPEVRQGSRRMMNFRVLIIALVGVIAAFGIIYAISTSIQPGGEGSVTQPGTQPTAPDTPAEDPITTPQPTI
jgi:hypothetical protein